ncbi:hypothetical protein BBBOND_0208750 [Babesia bigemina]|uniref:Uncharacterized protein n=1 Tax=Babesia bigemina TaxID=5866 RepID=A0A061D4U5_BABBI|nr:hypothetical protein BBBOND_0208750 [Babesia bigemina]CDR95721.1 hypothetical protein BBBOND_0208750 [Babesia bigemina]|eukprot:XP_012767907.1 hypothetical protein BBBOND_0208750 [Babesia bigemina]
MRNVQRVAAPPGYRWTPQHFVEKIREKPVDFITLLLFIAHILGFFCLLIVLKVRHSRRKLFAVSH